MQKLYQPKKNTINGILLICLIIYLFHSLEMTSINPVSNEVDKYYFYKKLSDGLYLVSRNKLNNGYKTNVLVRIKKDSLDCSIQEFNKQIEQDFIHEECINTYKLNCKSVKKPPCEPVPK